MILLYEALNGRDGHETGRLLLARAYHQATGEDLPPIHILTGGKPCFAQGKWHFSISHTKKHVFCLLAKKNVGLDAEEKDRSVSPAMLEKILSSAEKNRLGEDPRDSFLRLWVLKEAEAKRTGRGIGNWMKNTNFDPKDERIQEISGCYVAVLEDDDAV